MKEVCVVVVVTMPDDKDDQEAAGYVEGALSFTENDGMTLKGFDYKSVEVDYTKSI